MKNVLIDSDVILDFYFNREPYVKQTSKLLTLCEKKKIYGYLTPVIICNMYYILRKTNRHKSVINKLDQLLKITDVLSTGKNEIEQSLNSNFKDFEDAVQNYSAISHGAIDTIITRNIKDYRNSEISVMTPGQFLKSLHIDAL